MNTSWQQVFRPETEIHWGPWSTQLGYLLRAGWEAKVEEQDYMRRERRLFLRCHEADIWGVSETVDLDRQARSLAIGGDRLRISMQIAQKITFQTMGEIPGVGSLLDAKVGMAVSSRLDEVEVFFGSSHGQAEELIVEPSQWHRCWKLSGRCSLPKRKSCCTHNVCARACRLRARWSTHNFRLRFSLLRGDLCGLLNECLRGSPGW